MGMGQGRRRLEGWVLTASIRDHLGLSPLAPDPRTLSGTVIAATPRWEAKTTVTGLTHSWFKIDFLRVKFMEGSIAWVEVF